MLVKLTPGLNFINVLRTAFMCVDPRSVRIQSNPQYLFTLLGSTCAKAARKTLMKSTPGLQIVKTANTKTVNNDGCLVVNTFGIFLSFLFLISAYVVQKPDTVNHCFFTYSKGCTLVQDLWLSS